MPEQVNPVSEEDIATWLDCLRGEPCFWLRALRELQSLRASDRELRLALPAVRAIAEAARKEKEDAVQEEAGSN